MFLLKESKNKQQSDELNGDASESSDEALKTDGPVGKWYSTVHTCCLILWYIIGDVCVVLVYKTSDDLVTGTEFVRPVIGYSCTLCNILYASEEEAKEEHCRSLSHREKVKVNSHVFISLKQFALNLNMSCIYFPNIPFCTDPLYLFLSF